MSALHSNEVRRTLSILLLLLVGLPLIAPLFARTAAAKLPLCCRKNGDHHCMGGMDMGVAIGSDHTLAALHARCPAFPKATAVTLMQAAFFVRTQSRFAEIVAHPNAQPQTEARYRIAFNRSRQKRGPPVILS
ncbi:hypothetical protein [Granulicella arctica]|uniref:hypothetical protein n=1 Tax=Granulicella arctica TaxID=940613 RepID=UPI0021E03EEC|nr:hypothetical protein [Granulicella arctica]